MFGKYLAKCSFLSTFVFLELKFFDMNNKLLFTSSWRVTCRYKQIRAQKLIQSEGLNSQSMKNLNGLTFKFELARILCSQCESAQAGGKSKRKLKVWVQFASLCICVWPGHVHPREEKFQKLSISIVTKWRHTTVMYQLMRHWSERTEH